MALLGVAKGFVQFDHRLIRPARGITVHAEWSGRRAVCGKSVEQFSPLTAEGMKNGHMCRKCLRGLHALLWRKEGNEA